MTEGKKLDVIGYIKSWKRSDWVAIAILVIFVIVMAIPIYSSKGGCEVARPNYKCETAKNVLIENCDYWGNFSCDSSADVSLPQIEWYIGNLCKIHNRYHSDMLDCSNLKAACNSVTGRSVCPIGV